jgi:hypothetical protein
MPTIAPALVPAIEWDECFALLKFNCTCMSYFEPPPESTSPIDFEFKSIFLFYWCQNYSFACLKVVLSSLKQLILLTLIKQNKIKSQLQKHCLTVIRISNTGN